MTIPDRSRLAIAELIFYVPALPVALFACTRQGWARSSGFLLVVLLSLVRIVGSALQIASTQETGDTKNLYIGALILRSIGFSFLISASLALITRLNTELPEGSRIPPRLLRLVNLVILVGIILGIVSGVELGNAKDQDAANSAKDKRKASVILFLVVYIITMMATVLTFFRIGKIMQAERKLLYAVALALPFLAVRLAYSIAIAFSSSTSGAFSYYDPSVWAQAFMSVLEEFIVVIIFLVVGLVATRRKDLNLNKGDGGRLEAHIPPKDEYNRRPQPGY